MNALAPAPLSDIVCRCLSKDPAHELTDIFQIQSEVALRIKGSFLFTTLRDHPRFRALLRRMNLGDQFRSGGVSVPPTPNSHRPAADLG